MLAGRKEATQGQNLEARRAACPRRKDPEISIAAGSLEQHDPMRSGSLDRAFSGLEIITSPPPSASCRCSQATLALVPLMTRSVTSSGMPPQWRRRRRRRRRGGGKSSSGVSVFAGKGGGAAGRFWTPYEIDMSLLCKIDKKDCEHCNSRPFDWILFWEGFLSRREIVMKNSGMQKPLAI